MIARLRRRFVALAVAATALVLFVLMGAVNVTNYIGIVSDAREVLRLLAENGGAFPEFLTDGSDRPADASRPEEPPDGELHRGLRDARGRRGGLLDSPEFAFETRFFSVCLDDGGQVLSVDTGMIAAVDEETAAVYAREVYASGRGEGFLGDYRYLKTAGESGCLVVFLDCGRSLSSHRSFLTACAAISAIGLLMVFALLAALSGRIVRPIAESYEKQRRFITDASHELKTPLAIIEADADVLEGDVGVSEWIEDIRGQTKRLADLTADLLTLSRMEEGGDGFTMIDFPLSDVVQEAVQSYQAPARVQDKTLTVDIKSLLTAKGDEKAIRQLVGILMDNAMKYTPPGGEIALSLTKAGKNARLSVSNDAHLDQKDLSHLFDRFYRADASRSSDTGGHGIGLSIAQAIVQAHKGRISASQEGGRLVIAALLPLTPEEKIHA